MAGIIEKISGATHIGGETTADEKKHDEKKAEHSGEKKEGIAEKIKDTIHSGDGEKKKDKKEKKKKHDEDDKHGNSSSSSDID